jgi:glycosyltransferase involved in cell wall biosynthesis
MAVGVLIPVHGFAPYLPEALDSVLEQSPAQVVVVDDGSPSPLTLGPEYTDRVTLVRREVAGGPAAARAAGLAALDPSLDLIALCDADDAWTAGKLAAQERAMEGDAGWCFGRALVVGPDGRPTGEGWFAPPAGRLEAATFALDLYASNPVPTSSVVLRRTALQDAGGFESPVRVAEDWELWLRLCRGGHNAVCEAGAVVRYRRHPGGLTADVTGLARALLDVHARHADLVGPRAAHAIEAVDRAALAAGLAHDGDHAGARAEWDRVATMRRLTRRERLIKAALGVPLLRDRVGRKDPYRG